MSNTIKTFGYGYLLGDAALITASMLQARQQAADGKIPITQTQKFNAVVGGGIYTVASAVGAIYGNPSTEKKLELLYGDMKRDLQKMGLTIPADATPELLANHDGILDQIQKFLYRNPTQVIHALFAIGGVKNMMGGLPVNGGKFDASTVASGALITLGGLVGLLVPEKPRDPAHPPQNFGEKVVAYAQEKPLRASANIFTANNAFLITGAMTDKKKYAASTNGAEYSWVFKLVTAAAYITSNFFLSRSKRDNVGSEQDDFITKLRHTCAQVVVAQPPAMQQAALQQVAGYLAARPEVHASADALVAEMQHEIRQLAPALALQR